MGFHWVVLVAWPYVPLNWGKGGGGSVCLLWRDYPHFYLHIFFNHCRAYGSGAPWGSAEYSFCLLTGCGLLGGGSLASSGGPQL